MTTDATPPWKSEPSFDTLFTLLANQQRRSILSHLTAMQGMTISYQGLIDVLTHSLAVSRDRLRLNLCHRHLPKLADHNLIEYDSKEKTIRYRSSDRLEPLLEIGHHSVLE